MIAPPLLRVIPTSLHITTTKSLPKSLEDLQITVHHPNHTNHSSDNPHVTPTNSFPKSLKDLQIIVHHSHPAHPGSNLAPLDGRSVPRAAGCRRNDVGEGRGNHSPSSQSHKSQFRRWRGKCLREFD